MKKNRILWAILIAATVIRIFNLGAGDITGSDEVFYAFRAIGPLDFDNAPDQTTPLQWTDPNIPGWTKLSMHDHPLLVFVVQRFFMGIFGENNFGFRLPSAILGVLSVYLIYLIAKKMFSEKAGLIAAALTAVTVNHVYISRLGIQESYVIFFLLLAFYLFLRALDEPKFFYWLGAALGLAFLTKYTTFIALPIFLTYLLIFKRNAFNQRAFWIGVAIAALIASPIFIYNLQLYRSFGHFDFQLSYIFGQDPEVWQSAPGKEQIGSLGDRARNFLPNLAKSNSWLFLALTAATVFYFAILALRKDRRGIFRDKILLDIAIFWLLILILFIGPSFRFLALLTPFIAIKIAAAADSLKKLPLVALGIILALEASYTKNSLIFDYPIGPEFWTWSTVRFESYNWGHNELEEYFSKELAGKYPLLTFNVKYQFLKNLKEAGVATLRQKNYQPYGAMIIYDPTIHSAAQLWTLDRRQIYYGWPVITTSQFTPAEFAAIGIHNYYFVIPDASVPHRKGAITNPDSLRLEQTLIQEGFEPILIKNKRGETAFRVYKFNF